MRFVYIDSQGREVPIPTVEALALRIELGAITDTTRFYDPAADLWAPAGEHEIFRSLTRELELKSEGFVAPPPATPAASPPDVPDAPVAEPPPAATGSRARSPGCCWAASGLRRQDAWASTDDELSLSVLPAIVMFESVAADVPSSASRGRGDDLRRSSGPSSGEEGLATRTGCELANHLRSSRRSLQMMCWAAEHSTSV